MSLWNWKLSTEYFEHQQLETDNRQLFAMEMCLSMHFSHLFECGQPKSDVVLSPTQVIERKGFTKILSLCHDRTLLFAVIERQIWHKDVFFMWQMAICENGKMSAKWLVNDIRLLAHDFLQVSYFPVQLSSAAKQLIA